MTHQLPPDPLRRPSVHIHRWLRAVYRNTNATNAQHNRAVSGLIQIVHRAMLSTARDGATGPNLSGRTDRPALRRPGTRTERSLGRGGELFQRFAPSGWRDDTDSFLFAWWGRRDDELFFWLIGPPPSRSRKTERKKYDDDVERFRNRPYPTSEIAGWLRQRSLHEFAVWLLSYRYRLPDDEDLLTEHEVQNAIRRWRKRIEKER